MDYLKNNLSKSRYEHTLAVARECDKMAGLFGISKHEEILLHTAALLHDITKEKTPDEHIELCRVYQIEHSETDKLTPALFHAKTGAEYARSLFPDQCPNEVAEIIRTHTTGCESMTLLQKLLLLADGIEETRKYRDLVELREYFYALPEDETWVEHLNKTVIKYLDITIMHLIRNSQLVDLQTIKARNYLMLK